MTKEPTKQKAIQPIKYGQALADKIIDLVYMGQSGRQIAKLAGMPHHNTMTKWRRKYPEFGLAWHSAWQESAYEVEEECLEIADKCIVDINHIKKAKLKIDVRLKMLAARKPEIYGNKIDLKVEDKPLSDKELDQKLLAAIEKAKSLG